MVATERIKLAVTEDELKELRAEKEALKRALHIIEGENLTLRERNSYSKSAPDLPYNPTNHVQSPILPVSRSRSSSEVAIKSRPNSLVLLESTVPLPPSPAPEVGFDRENGPGREAKSSSLDSSHSQASDDPQATPKRPPSPSLSFSYPSEFEYISPWVDAPSARPKVTFTSV
jgi:hypothetical protein